MAQKMTGALVFDERTDRYDIRFDLNSYYGGLQTMRTLGRNIAFMAKSIALGKEQFGLPEKEQITFTNFHH